MTDTILLTLVFFILVLILYFLSRKSLQTMFFLLRSIIKHNWFVYSCIAIIYFPGTVVHEMSHFFAAIVLFLRVRDIHLLPEWDNKSIKLGHVTYEKADPIRGLIVGISPLFGAMLFFWMLYQFQLFPHDSIWIMIGVGYIIFSVSSTMFSSKQDLVDLIAGVGIFSVFSILIGLVLFLFQVDVGALFKYVPAGVYGHVNNFLYPINVYMYFCVWIHGGIVVLYYSLKKLQGKKRHVQHGHHYPRHHTSHSQ